jgi:hypothetical protein
MLMRQLLAATALMPSRKLDQLASSPDQKYACKLFKPGDGQKSPRAGGLIQPS